MIDLKIFDILNDYTCSLDEAQHKLQSEGPSAMVQFVQSRSQAYNIACTKIQQLIDDEVKKNNDPANSLRPN